MNLDAVWVAAMLSALIAFCTIVGYRLGFRKGYKTGGLHVLGEWKHHMGLIEEAHRKDKENGGKE